MRNFIYLDEQKMYSLSSQIFEGITEYMLNESTSGDEKSESQKGPISSGRILADVIKSSEKYVEKKFLHDYSYSIFEKKIIEDEKVLAVSENDDVSSVSARIKGYSFVRVKARAKFKDFDKIAELFGRFNEIGEAFARVTVSSEIQGEKQKFDDLMAVTKDKNQRVKLERAFRDSTNIRNIAKNMGLYLDQEFMNDISLITNYGFSGQFEVQQARNDLLFSANLKRECLREREDLLIKKYSRETEREIVVLGMVSQAFDGETQVRVPKADVTNLRDAYTNIVDSLTTLEGQFYGKASNEIIVDPIALYFEL